MPTLNDQDTTKLIENPQELHFKLQNIWRRDDGVIKTLDVLPLVRETLGGAYRLKMTFQGRLVKAETFYTDQREWKRGQRGTVFNFSQASRRRLMELFNRLEMPKKVIFMTLTYPEDYPDAKTAKKHLRALLERFRRAYPQQNISAIWRMEFQERGAPHFHLVFFNLPFIPKERLQEAWGEICGTDRPFTRIEMIRSHKMMVNYVSKYVAKVNPEGEKGGFNPPTYLHAHSEKHGHGVGRYWGTFNRANLPFAQLMTLEWPKADRAFMAFRQAAIMEYPPLEQQRGLGFTLYVKSAVHWKYLFERQIIF